MLKTCRIFLRAGWLTGFFLSEPDGMIVQLLGSGKLIRLNIAPFNTSHRLPKLRKKSDLSDPQHSVLFLWSRKQKTKRLYFTLGVTGGQLCFFCVCECVCCCCIVLRKTREKTGKGRRRVASERKTKHEARLALRFLSHFGARAES